MKKLSLNLLIAGVILTMAVGQLSAQQNIIIARSVIGSGGMVSVVSQNSTNNIMMSGVMGQVAIEKLTGTSWDVYQGFWVPDANAFVGVNDNTNSNDGKILNFPNPFSISTTIKYNLPYSGDVTLKIFDLQGNVVKVLVNETQTMGSHEVVWNGKNELGVDLASGSYLYEVILSGSQASGFAGSNTFNLRNIMIINR